MKSIKRMLKGEEYYNLKFLYAYFRRYYYLYELTDYPNLDWPLRMLIMKVTPLLDSLQEDFTKEGKDEIN